MELLVERDHFQRILRLDAESILLGRGQECQVRLEDPLASRQHCRLERLGDETFLVDLGSSNGTWMHGEKVGRCALAPGQEFRIGSTTIRLQGPDGPALSAGESTMTQQASREKRMLDTLLSVARAMQNEHRPEKIAPLLIDAAILFSGAERGFVFLVEGDKTTFALGRNFARESVPSPEQKFSRTLLEKALAADGPLLVEDAASDGDFAGVASIADLGLRSILAVPMRSAGKVVGLIVVDHRMQGGAFQREEISLLAGCASLVSLHLGSALERRRSKTMQRKLQNLQRQLGKRMRSETQADGQAETADGRGFAGILGTSPAMAEIAKKMARVVDVDLPVLLTGESGTGKEIVAGALHFHGPRGDSPFVVVNCGALPDTLLESELFGHKKGAFTGAIRDHAGRLLEAEGGTLFLDEVGEMSAAMQARFLRFLENGELQALGSDAIRKVNVRIISATNADLIREIEEHRFRQDLFYRLCVVPLHLPPLRERGKDVELLAEHFLEKEALAQGRLPRTLSHNATMRLLAAFWPGNVRQLRNEMRRLILMGEGEISPEDLDEGIFINHTQGTANDGGLDALIERVEKKAIAEALQKHAFNITKTAASLHVTRYVLQRKVQKYGLKEDS